jgi:streptogramin lyase
MVVFASMINNVSSAASKDLGKGFKDHGVCTPLSNHRGIVATKDGGGRDIVLAWLMDHRGCYELLLVDAETARSEEFPIPAPTGGDAPYASILSSGGRYYTHFGSHFYEFDPAQRKFTFVHETAPQMAMGMTEDDRGVIWSVSYPQSGVVSYDPKSGEFTDYGHVYKQDWAQYQRYVAMDDSGWLYFGIGSTASQIIAFDPATRTATPLLAEAERLPAASGVVYPDVNGKVYGCNGGAPDKWMELYQGRRTDLPQAPAVNKKPIITSSQGLFHQQFPDGKVLKEFDTVERRMVIEDPATRQTTELSFSYESEGAHIMAMCAAPDGTMCGGSAFPFRFFSYNPATDEWVRHKAFLQFNTVVRQGDRWYTGGYGEGFLLEWDPTQPWVDTVKDTPGCNPLFLAEANPDINRPHDLLAHPDGKTLVLAGTPGYGLTGGGLLFWDREKREAQVIKHAELISDHAPMSLVALPEGKLLVGTTIEPGTGGAVKAKVAELFIMDMASKQVEWHEAILPGVRSYTDMCMGPNGLVFGFADCRRFLVFDPRTRVIVAERDITAELGGTNGGQQTRTFVFGPDGTIYVLLRKGIARLDPETFAITLLAESPVGIGAGGDWLDGRIYFGSGSHMYSWSVPAK